MSVLVKEVLEGVLFDLDKDTPAVREKVSQFLLDNSWFNIPINKSDFTVSEVNAVILRDKVVEYLSAKPGIQSISTILKQRYPATEEYFKQYVKDSNLDETSQFYLQDFLAYYLTKDLFLYSDKELEKLIEQVTEILSKNHGDECIAFASWLLQKGVTRYRNTYEMTSRYTLEDKNGAYELNDYLKLMFYLFNDNYIQENEMLAQAASSKDYADT